MQPRAFYRVVLLLPLVGLALAAGMHGRPSPPDLDLPPGGSAGWVYPPFLARGLLAYGIVMVWLSRELRRRSVQAFASLLWLLPVVYVGVSSALFATLALAHGQAAEILEEQAGRIALRLAVQLGLGYGYIGLVTLARERLRAGGYFTEDAPRSQNGS